MPSSGQNWLLSHLLGASSGQPLALMPESGYPSGNSSRRHPLGLHVPSELQYVVALQSLTYCSVPVARPLCDGSHVSVSVVVLGVSGSVAEVSARLYIVRRIWTAAESEAWAAAEAAKRARGRSVGSIVAGKRQQAQCTDLGGGLSARRQFPRTVMAAIAAASPWKSASAGSASAHDWPYWYYIRAHSSAYLCVSRDPPEMVQRTNEHERLH